MLKDPALKLDMKAEKSAPNRYGIYHDTYRPKESKRRNHCYYLCDPDGNEHVNSPPVGKAWYNTIPEIADEIQALERASRNKEQRQFPPDVIDLISIAKHQQLQLRHKRQNENQEEHERSAKRLYKTACHSTSSTSNNLSGIAEADVVATVEDASPLDMAPQLAPGYNIWWQSTEAFRLFNASKEKETTIDRLEDLIAVLDNANSTAMSYKTIVDGLDADDTMSEHKKEDIRMKARYLAQAYRIAIEEMPFKTWNDCCREAIDQLATVHINYIKNEKVLQRWNVEFCKKKLFRIKHRGTRDLPAFLDAHPIVVTVMKEYGRENLSDLSIDSMHSYLHNTIIKSLVIERLQGQEATSDSHEFEEEKIKLLREYGLSCLCHTTTYRWMLQLGFQYETRRKGYYVDGHEKKATVEYRWDFCQRYLSLERQMFRWIQVSLDEAKKLQELGKVAKGSGYEYKDELTGNTMVEYHVDTCKEFMDKMNNESVFGGNISLRSNPEKRPLIVFGQDECIVKQYSFTHKSWNGPNREQALIPKDDGLGVMISAFVSREFGYGVALTSEELHCVNAERLGKKYKDETAAKKKRGNELKQPLTSSPFVLEFEYGASAEGYWTYDSMVLQLEDCVDVVKTLYPQYDFLFLFDHSCGHDRMPDDALRVEGMNKGYGGEQNKMKDSMIKSAHGYLGPHDHDRKLKVGNVQSMVFRPSDDGPYWMTPEEQQQTRKDHHGTTVTIKEYTKPQLVEMLRHKGINNAKGNKQQIKNMAERAGIPLTYQKQDIIEGWEGKAKGMEQILWERGWINPNEDRKSYTVHGKKDSMGAVRKDTSL